MALAEALVLLYRRLGQYDDVDRAPSLAEKYAGKETALFRALTYVHDPSFYADFS